MDVTRNRDAELAAIGVCLMDRPCAVRLAALPEDAFTALDTQSAHRAIRKIISDGDAPDLVGVATAMYADLSNPEQMLVDAMQKGMGPSFYAQYETILYDCLKRRTVLSAATKMLQGASSAGVSMDSLIAESLEYVRGVGSTRTSVKLSDALEKLFDRMKEGDKLRCQTGVANLDRLTGGVDKGNMVVIGARPGVGKTAFALAIATHVAMHSGPVLFVSLEMSEEEIAARVCAASSGIDMQKIANGCLEEREWDIFCPTMGELANIPLLIDTMARTPAQIRREAVTLQNTQGLAMIVVDYIQLLHSDKRNDSRYQEVSEVSRELKLMAMDLGVPIIALTQFNRESEKTFGSTAERRKPKMSEAKDSGSIEQDANMFLVQWAPSPPTEQGTKEWEDYLACERNGWEWQVLEVEKNRQGRTGRISMAFDKPHMRFLSLETRRDSEW